MIMTKAERLRSIAKHWVRDAHNGEMYKETEQFVLDIADQLESMHTVMFERYPDGMIIYLQVGTNSRGWDDEKMKGQVLEWIGVDDD
jgi:hypothetical protein